MQLKNVLLKQNETKNDLVQELQKLTIESQKQNKYVSQLKNKLEEDKNTASIRLVKEMSPKKYDPSAEKYYSRKSKGKPCLLFNSNNFR